MKLKTLLVAGAALLTTSVAQASSMEDVLKSTYKLIDGRGICSAQAVSPTQLTTAFHCVDGKGDYAIQVVKQLGADDEFEVTAEKILYVKVLRGVKAKDVAFLELKDKEEKLPTFVEIADEAYVKDLKIGTPLTAVTYPMVEDLTITNGVFTGLVKAPDGLPVEEGLYKTTVPVTGGSSGGGLYLSKVVPEGIDYKLIGMTTGGYQHVDFMSYFSTTKSLNDVIRGLITLPTYDKDGKIVEKKTEEKVDEKKVGDLINPSDLK